MNDLWNGIQAEVKSFLVDYLYDSKTKGATNQQAGASEFSQKGTKIEHKTVN